ncbi:hypothetical protein ACFQUU_08490 [Herbaspirillum sp. GCM10030257]|uniref:hypothetical protein n=1 Tax=Herbaspirillum sp. GCM10030257 TaxID=3273393 RepID=UPI003621003E
MTRLLLPLALLVTLSACMITRDGAQVSQPPPAVQGSNDVQGNPLSTPGAGMGVGSGNPAGPGPSGLGGSSRK